MNNTFDKIYARMPKRLEILAILRLHDCDVYNKHLPHHIALLGQGMLVNCNNWLRFELTSHRKTIHGDILFRLHYSFPCKPSRRGKYSFCRGFDSHRDTQRPVNPIKIRHFGQKFNKHAFRNIFSEDNLHLVGFTLKRTSN